MAIARIVLCSAGSDPTENRREDGPGPDLGRLDVCLRVADIARSQEFYRKLGFRAVEGYPADGWAVLAAGETRISLYTRKFMNAEFSLNFREGSVPEIVNALADRGLWFSFPPVAEADGSGSAELLDPDGNLIFFDSTPEEIANRG